MHYTGINCFFIRLCSLSGYESMVMHMNRDFSQFIVDVIILLVVKHNMTIRNTIIILLKLLHGKSCVLLNRVMMLRCMAHRELNPHFSWEMLLSVQLSSVHIASPFVVI